MLNLLIKTNHEIDNLFFKIQSTKLNKQQKNKIKHRLRTITKYLLKDIPNIIEKNT